MRLYLAFRVSCTKHETVQTMFSSIPCRIQLQGPPFSFTEVEISPICQCPCTSEPPVSPSKGCVVGMWWGCGNGYDND